MSKSVVAGRYALALFNLAQENGETASIQEELLELKKVFQDNPELEQLLNNPKLATTSKKELLGTVFASASQFIQNTLFVLLEKGRMEETINLVDEFNTLANDSVGIAEATVFSTRALTAEESTAISTSFGKKVGKQSLRIKNTIDPSLIGGVRLQIGNRIYDSSVSAKLERLKWELIGS